MSKLTREQKEMLEILNGKGADFDNYDGDDFRLGLIRPPASAGSPNHPALTPTMGAVRNNIVAEANFRVRRRLVFGVPSAATLPVAFGSPFSAKGGYRRIINQLLPAGVTFFGYAEDINQNTISFIYNTGVGLETVSIESDFYDTVTFKDGLINIKALLNSLSITTPDKPAIVNSFINNPLVPFNHSWLTKTDKDQRMIRFTSGQFNKNVFDINVQLTLDPSNGFAFSVPANVDIEEIYNVQLFIGQMLKF